jgi:hypothetical protein
MNKEKLTELVYINLGRASMCWSDIPSGTFDSTKAADLGKEIMEAVEKYVEAQEETPGWSDPMLDYLNWEENYNKESEWQRRKRLEAMKEAKQKEESYTRSLKELVRQKEEREEKELIKKILADPRNADGYADDEHKQPRFVYEGYTYILNLDLNRIIGVEVPREVVDRKWLMDDLKEQDAAWERIKKNK